MAKFEIADKITGRNEGGYADNHADHGGETYAGIARNFWPNWKGWLIIDRIKAQQGHIPSIINSFAKKDIVLQKEIASFYKANFWDINSLDKFNDQQLANSVYDFGVNSGTKKAAKVLQDTLGLVQDGVIGPKTLSAVNLRDAKSTLKVYNEKRKQFYLTLAKNPSQHQFLASWLSRLKDYA